MKKTITLNEYEIVEYKFAKAFSDYVKLFNLFDFNIGLSIRWMVNNRDPSAAHPFLDRLSIHQKLEVLKELLSNKKSEENIKSFKKDFDDWFKLAAKSKAARNQYIHGLWDVNPHVNKPIRFTPVNWVKGCGGNNTEEMTLDEFLKKMKKIEDVFNRFMDLRNKYGF